MGHTFSPSPAAGTKSCSACRKKSTECPRAVRASTKASVGADWKGYAPEWIGTWIPYQVGWPEKVIPVSEYTESFEVVQVVDFPCQATKVLIPIPRTTLDLGLYFPVFLGGDKAHKLCISGQISQSDHTFALFVPQYRLTQWSLNEAYNFQEFKHNPYEPRSSSSCQLVPTFCESSWKSQKKKKTSGHHPKKEFLQPLSIHQKFI